MNSNGGTPPRAGAHELDRDRSYGRCSPGYGYARRARRRRAARRPAARSPRSGAGGVNPGARTVPWSRRCERWRRRTTSAGSGSRSCGSRSAAARSRTSPRPPPASRVVVQRGRAAVGSRFGARRLGSRAWLPPGGTAREGIGSRLLGSSLARARRRGGAEPGGNDERGHGGSRGPSLMAHVRVLRAGRPAQIRERYEFVWDRASERWWMPGAFGGVICPLTMRQRRLAHTVLPPVVLPIQEDGDERVRGPRYRLGTGRSGAPL